jgi:steroid delta-isomerase-like uncharacterized protein
MSSQLDVCKAHLEAEDKQDIEATLATFTDQDPYYKMPAFGVWCRGKGEIAEHYRGAFTAFPDFVNVYEKWHEAEGNVFLEVIYEGTHEGEGPWPGMKPTGRKVRQQTLAHFPIAEDGLLTAEIVYIDSLEMLHQLGMLPTANAVELSQMWADMHGKVEQADVAS